MRSDWWRDPLLAVVLLVACAIVNDPGDQLLGHEPAWWLASFGAAVAVALRRAAPLPMLALAFAGLGTHLLMAAPVLLIDMAAPIVLYTVASRYRRVVSAGALAGLLSLIVGWGVVQALSEDPGSGLAQAVKRMLSVQVAPGAPSGPGAPGAVIVPAESAPVRTGGGGLSVLAAVLVAAWAIGSGARNRQAYEREMERASAADERARISRELHDVVAHGLSVMVVQAQGGAAALDNRPSDTRTALEAIVRTGRDSLADMRRVLSVQEQPWQPPPGLAKLANLVGQVEGATLRLRGEVGGLPAPVDLSAYRIVQEALTNTLKHAGPGARAEVTVTVTAGEVTIEVVDDGAVVSTTDGGGQGLRGMRQRVEMLGGTLSTGAAAGGGFAVHAVLPRRGGRP